MLPPEPTFEPTEAQLAVEAGDGSIRQRALRGGAYLMAREAMGMVVRLVGVTVVVRVIGPSSYGLYAGALAFVSVATLAAQGGTEVFLIRQQAEPDEDLYAHAYTYLLVASMSIVAVALGLSFAAGVVVHSSRALWVFRALLLVVPVNVLWAPAQACLERRFDFRSMGIIELVGDLVLYAVAVPLALAHFGPWSLVAGYAAWQTWLLLASLVVSRLRPRIKWSRATSGQLLRHGFSYAASDWISAVGALANPVIVGSWIGAAGVGYVSLASRLVDTASFAIRGAWRVGLASLSRVHERERLRRGLEEASLLQFLALSCPIALLAAISPVVIPRLYGKTWSPVIVLVVWFGLAAVLRSPMLMQVTLLYSRGRNVPMVITAAISQAIIVAVAVTLVPRIGVDGYGVAVASGMVGYIWIDRVVRREIVPFGYGLLVPFAIALVPVVLLPLAPFPWSLAMLLPSAVVVALPGPRQSLARVAKTIKVAVRRPGPA
ncbi:MAG: oligosaccharide flippase family protein [Acidimicrobiales bacterium]